MILRCSERRVRLTKKWLGSNLSIELLTPNPYLIDFIELSGIKQEEAIDSLQGYYCKSPERSGDTSTEVWKD